MGWWGRIRAMLRGEEDERRRAGRLAAVEEFRRQLVERCGEEPTVFVGMEAEVGLADYLGTVLQARSGAVYWRRGEEFRRLAQFGLPAKGEISRSARNDVSAGAQDAVGAESALPRWLAQNGLLVRPRLRLSGMSAEEAEMLLAELDRLDARLVSPVVVNEDLWGFISAGPGCAPAPAAAPDAGDELYLSLYAINLAQCVSRRRMGLPTRAETEARQQAEQLKQAEQLWAVLRPGTRRVRLAVLDTEEEAAHSLCRFFDQWGFEATHFITSSSRKRGSGPRFREPALILRVARDAIWLEAPAAGVRQRLPKPCRFAVLARWVFEAAAALAVQLEEASTGRGCLLVDEDREANQALQEYFRAKGCRVWGVASAEEAVPVAARVRPELVLVDVKHPQPDGAEWVGRIRRASPQSRVVVMAPALGMTPSSEVLVKPVRVERLEELLHA